MPIPEAWVTPRSYAPPRHTLRAALLAWAALAAVIAGILAVPHGWFGTLVPVPVVAIAPTAVVFPR